MFAISLMMAVTDEKFEKGKKCYYYADRESLFIISVYKLFYKLPV